VKLHIVTIAITDHRNGSDHALSFSHHNRDAAEILRSALCAARNVNGGGLQQYGAERMDHYQIREVSRVSTIELPEVATS
jgi:hypothetical protein